MEVERSATETFFLTGKFCLIATFGRNNPSLTHLKANIFQRGVTATLTFILGKTQLVMQTVYCPAFPRRLSQNRKQRQLIVYDGEPCWVRTSDLLIKSQLLYRLS